MADNDQLTSRGRQSTPRRVVVLGSLNMDISVSVTQLPTPGETVLATGMSQQPGGKGGNQAVAAARLGGDVTLIARLGNDALADQIRAVLKDAAVDLSHVREEHALTGQAFITVDAQGENVIVVSSGANAGITPQTIAQEADALRSAAIAVTQLETPMEAVVHFASLCEELGVDLVLNAAPFRSIPDGLLSRCRYLVLNRDEAQSLTGVDVTDRASATDALLKARHLGAERIVITVGGQGCVALADGEMLELDAYDVPVVDTTGAGDAFVGAFAVALAGKAEIGDAIRFAAATGAVACTRPGAQSLASREETERLMAQQPLDTRRRPISQLHRTTSATDG